MNQTIEKISLKDKIIDGTQRLGKAILLPIAILPVAGLLLGVSAALSNGAVKATYPILANQGFQNVMTIMNSIGSGVFAALPLIFAVGIATGLAKAEKGSAGLSAVVGYFVLILTLNGMLKITNGIPTEGDIRLVGLANQFGIITLNMSVFGGILAGIVTSFVHNRYYKIKLPEILSFFGGSRFVPIMNTVVFVFVAVVMFFVWPPIASTLTSFGSLITGMGIFGAILYGLVLRMFYIIGLHHAFYLPFWTTAIGGSLMVGGELVTGFQNIFLAQLGDPTVTQFFGNLALYNSGRYFHMLFGLPAVCYAMYKTIEDPKKRKATSGFLISIALTCFITGVTEPISFALLFASPILFFAEAGLFACVFGLAAIMKITIGSTFSAGLIEFLLFGVFQGNAKTNYIWILVLGVVVAVVYYFVFKFLILKLNAKTPGRDEEKITDDESKLKSTYQSGQAKEIIDALGGRDNIVDLDNCATRLRVTVKKIDMVNIEAFKKTGGQHTIVRGKSLQIIYGPTVNLIRLDIDQYLESL